ncbi:branched-chain amino acid ABC transporter permease [Denitratisoma sp. DHT3]|uniref:branched-chain amino acid ABC transporter permease n=1 Tax=Denitratisoma sp. DHT3 TaxID=1981880 RepID=UPI001198727C|nr:branched-chain amino acid ABC transporter permease [Denitratisoma sp. DHT3]QDX81896.1 branched-chain amino acid ABC transporter permease [Denitratisoma sp. DHT3]
METFLQQIANGLVLGAIYALVALGYTMVYGILGLINFAHGEVVMVGALVTLAAIKALAAAGVPGVALLPLGLALAMAVCMALGAAVERIAYRPLRNAPRLAPLITAIGVSIVLQYGAVLIWGRGYHAYPELLPTAPLDIFGARVSPAQLIVMAVSALIMAGLLWLVHRTRFGRAMRATAENPAVARLMGVDVDRVISLTFVIGSALGAVAGVLVSINYSVAHYQMGFILGLKAFTAAVLGGIGNLAGAMVGGLLLGLIEALGSGYVGDLTGGLFGSNYRDVFAFLVLVGVLILRPAGLLGERVAERA